jgi:hypothetical protein
LIRSATSLHAVFEVDVAEADIGALFRECSALAGAHALGGAGDEDVLSLETRLGSMAFPP